MRFPFKFIAALITLQIGKVILPDPYQREVEYFVNQKLPNQVLDPNTLAQLARRGEIKLDDFTREAAKSGIAPAKALQLFELTRNLIGIGDLSELRLRGEITDKEFISKARVIGFEANDAENTFRLLQKRLPEDAVIRGMWRDIKFGTGIEAYKKDLRDQGWSNERIEVLEKTSRFYPSVGDFITFMVRDTFTEEIVKKYQYDEMYPEAIDGFVEKAGVDPEWMKHFWRAHWVLPSPSMVYEMLHRGVITMVEMKDLLKIADYAPYWIDKMIQISYNPFTRVDVRRMNKIGVLNREEVKTAYMDLGFDDDKAEKMTVFTEIYNADPEDSEKTEEDKRKDELRGLTRTAIIKQYQKELLPEEEAKSYLLDIGMAEEVAQAYLDLATYSEEEERVDDYLRVFKKMYLNDVISFNDLSDALDKLNLPATYKDHIVDLWDLEKIGKASIPSKTELGNFLKKGIITQETYIANMSSLGYNEIFINWYLKALGAEVEV